jgi:transcriptional regulator with XRE-family HTH domain
MNLRDFMRHHAIAPVEMSRLAGVDHSTLWRLLNGKGIPNRKTREKIAAATKGQVSERDLLREAAEVVEAAA